MKTVCVHIDVVKGMLDAIPKSALKKNPAMGILHTTVYVNRELIAIEAQPSILKSSL